MAFALLPIPSAMSEHDRGVALTILGYGSAMKVLDDPYPLGGYSGLEVGLASSMMTTDQISSLGTKTSQQAQTSFNTLSVGKGIYDNIDTFVQFSYLGQQENVMNFGAQVRWGFFQAEYLPVYMSAIFHGDSTNYENLITTTTMGVDGILGVHEGDVTLYVGIGIIRAMGTFAGGTGGITDSGVTVQNGVEDSRFLAGLNVKFGHMFTAVEIVSYNTPVYGAKLGMRF